MQEDKMPLFSLTVGEFKELLNEVITTKFNEIIAPKPINREDQLIKIGELCQILKISRVTVFSWIKKGKLKPYYLNSRLYFKMKDVESELNSRGGN